jgi:hypothetical protein
MTNDSKPRTTTSRAAVRKSAATRNSRGSNDGATVSEKPFPVCVTIDPTTRSILELMNEKMKLGSFQGTARKVLTAVADGTINRNQLRKFYLDKWIHVVPDGNARSVTTRFMWSEKEDEALIRVSNEVLSRPNKSEAFRLAVIYYAIRHGHAHVGWTEVAKIEVDQ